jgi:hypothetical protein
MGQKKYFSDSFGTIIGKEIKKLHICHTNQSFLIVLITSIEQKFTL